MWPPRPLAAALRPPFSPPGIAPAPGALRRDKDRDDYAVSSFHERRYVRRRRAVGAVARAFFSPCETPQIPECLNLRAIEAHCTESLNPAAKPGFRKLSINDSIRSIGRAPRQLLRQSDDTRGGLRPR